MCRQGIYMEEAATRLREPKIAIKTLQDVHPVPGVSLPARRPSCDVRSRTSIG